MPNNLRFSGTVCDSLVMTENDSDMEDLELSLHNMSLDGTCAKFGVF